MLKKFIEGGHLVATNSQSLLKGYWQSRGSKIGEWRRVYLFHIRKTAGTSLNHMFLSISGGDSRSLYERLANVKSHMLSSGGMSFVGWNKFIINSGFYFYGFSHIPLHQLQLPKKTYRITVFRDPVERVVSHYKMLYEYRQKGIRHPCMKSEGQWLGSGFSDFVENIPNEHLLNQLYMFSRSFDKQEAFDRVLGIERFFFTDGFAEGVKAVNKDLGLSLEPIHIRKTSLEHSLPEPAMQILRDRLSMEYEFLDMLRN